MKLVFTTDTANRLTELTAADNWMLWKFLSSLTPGNTNVVTVDTAKMTLSQKAKVSKACKSLVKLNLVHKVRAGVYKLNRDVLVIEE